MKKYIALLTAIFAPAALLPAADFSLSAGGGGLLGYTFTRYALEGGMVKSTQSMDRINYGGGVFFDAAYGEFAVMFQGGNNSYAEKMDYGATSLADSKGRGSEASLGFSLLGKYPFRINEKIAWFPLLGAEYQIALVEKRRPKDGAITYDRAKGYLVEDRDKNGKPYPLSAWNSWWIDVGAGVDYNITGRLFLRGELLFGFRLRADYETGALEVVQNPPVNAKDPKLTGLTGGPALKIAAGWRFWGGN